MSYFDPQELSQKLGSGLLSFPVTAFNDDLSFNEARYREHLSWLSSYDIAGLFASGGTGEFFSLTNEEVRQTLRASVQEVKGKMPVLAPAGGSTANAIELVKIAEKEGASGVLLFPPYLTEASQDGLADHIEAVTKSTKLGVVVYSRANAILQAETLLRLAGSLPNLIGFKDGTGNIEQMTKIYSKLGDRFMYIGGLPTAETFALPYLELGIHTYSSAMFNFVPDFALKFYQAVLARDYDFVYSNLRDFVLPYLDIRDRKLGYAVSIVKAGVSIVGNPIGSVRPPLTNLTKEEIDQLAQLIKKVS